MKSWPKLARVLVVACVLWGAWPLVRNATESALPERAATGYNASIPNGTATVPAATKPEETERPVTKSAATKPIPAPHRYTGQRQREFESRWNEVQKAIGSPPSLDAVPVLGYVSGGVRYPARWRTTPDDSLANNYKPPSTKKRED